MGTILSQRRFLSPGEEAITIVLKHAGNVKPGKFESRLVHTWVYSKDEDGTFDANDDDRAEHLRSDEGRTWCRGHAAPDSPAGSELLEAAADRDEVERRRAAERITKREGGC